MDTLDNNNNNLGFNILDILKESFCFLTKNIKSLFLSFIFIIFIEVLVVLIFSSPMLEGIGAIINSILNFVIVIIIFSLYQDDRSKRELSLKNSFSLAYKNIFRVFFTGLQVLVFGFLRILLFIIPGVHYFVSRQFAVFAILYKPELSITEAKEFSKNLVKGKWWKVFLINILYVLTILVVLLPILTAITMSSFISATASGEPSSIVQNPVINIIMSFFYNYFVQIFSVVFFFKMVDSSSN